MKQYTTMDAYIASFPSEVQALLQKMRVTIQNAAPEAKEKIAYGLATFTFHGNLVHFGGFKDHIGFYPAPAGIEEFKKELAPYISGKGTLQFPLDKPIPYDLVTKITKFRAEQNLQGKKE